MSKTYKQIEDSRNTRLWITTVIVPLVTSAAMLYSNPEIKSTVDKTACKIKGKCNKIVGDVKNRIEDIKNKKGEEA